MNPLLNSTGKKQQKMNFKTKNAIIPIAENTQSISNKIKNIKKNLKHPIYFRLNFPLLPNHAFSLKKV